MVEILLNHWGKGRFQAYSAGSQPTGTVNPYSIKTLECNNIPIVEKPRSKSWDEFSKDGAPELDFIFTVCGNAANEICPVWLGAPLTAHWGVADPAVVEGTEIQKIDAFQTAFLQLESRVKAFVGLPLSILDPLNIKMEIDNIGRL